MDDLSLAGRSFLFLDEKKRTKEKSKQYNAPARIPSAPPAVLLGQRACVREFNPIIISAIERSCNKKSLGLYRQHPNEQHVG